jgi:hypothetical protein
MLLPLLILTLAAPADSPNQAESHWQLNLDALTARPAVLPGVSLGAAAEAQWHLSSGYLLARLGWDRSSAANVEWIINHDQFIAALGAGLSATLGEGRLFLQAGAGASGIYEVLGRHQRQRIDTAGTPGGSRSTFTAGPLGFAEAGLALTVRNNVSCLLAVGPSVVRTVVSGSPLWRFGGSARLGVAYDF